MAKKDKKVISKKKDNLVQLTAKEAQLAQEAFRRVATDGLLRSDALIVSLLNALGIPVSPAIQELCLTRYRLLRGRVTVTDFQTMLVDCKRLHQEWLRENQLAVEQGDTIDAFVAVGGGGDMSGIMDVDIMKNIINDYKLLVDIERVVAEIDQDGNAEIDYFEFADLLNAEHGDATLGGAPAEAEESDSSGHEFIAVEGGSLELEPPSQSQHRSISGRRSSLQPPEHLLNYGGSVASVASLSSGGGRRRSLTGNTSTTKFDLPQQSTVYHAAASEKLSSIVRKCQTATGRRSGQSQRKLLRGENSMGFSGLYGELDSMVGLLPARAELKSFRSRMADIMESKGGGDGTSGSLHGAPSFRDRIKSRVMPQLNFLQQLSAAREDSENRKRGSDIDATELTSEEGGSPLGSKHHSSFLGVVQSVVKKPMKGLLRKPSGDVDGGDDDDEDSEPGSAQPKSPHPPRHERSTKRGSSASHSDIHASSPTMSPRQSDAAFLFAGRGADDDIRTVSSASDDSVAPYVHNVPYKPPTPSFEGTGATFTSTGANQVRLTALKPCAPPVEAKSGRRKHGKDRPLYNYHAQTSFDEKRGMIAYQDSGQFRAPYEEALYSCYFGELSERRVYNPGSLPQKSTRNSQDASHGGTGAAGSSFGGLMEFVPRRGPSYSHMTGSQTARVDHPEEKRRQQAKAKTVTARRHPSMEPGLITPNFDETVNLVRFGARRPALERSEKKDPAAERRSIASSFRQHASSRTTPD